MEKLKRGIDFGKEKEGEGRAPFLNGLILNYPLQ
jgi:hypothetical protein